MRKSKEEVKIFKRSRRIDHIKKKMDPVVKNAVERDIIGESRTVRELR